jgi:hypothetical protein
MNNILFHTNCIKFGLVVDIFENNGETIVQHFLNTYIEIDEHLMNFWCFSLSFLNVPTTIQYQGSSMQLTGRH